MHYDLIDLRLMLNVGETLNLTRAAERSFLSLPAASTRIRNLEEAFRAQLLLRHPKGVALTPAGEALLLHARTVFRQLECLHADLQPYAAGLKGTLRVLANTTATNAFLPAALSAFMARYPDVDIELEERLSREIVPAVQSGAADLGIVAGRVDTRGLEVWPLRQDELIVIAAPGYPLQHVAGIQFADLLDQHRFVGINPVSAIQSFLDEIASSLGKRMSLRVRVGSFDAVCRMVEAGAGIAIVPRSCLERYAGHPGLRQVRLTDPWAVRELRLCLREGDLLPAFAGDFIEALKRAAAA
ncbi:MAG: LysR family transcriptional regulator [Pigmentiphaga sp.]